MARMLHILSVAVIVAAGIVLIRCVQQWGASDPEAAVLLAAPSAVERFGTGVQQRAMVADGQVSPLVAQAQMLAGILDPPKPLVPPEPVRIPSLQNRAVAKTASPLVRREEPKMMSMLELRSHSVRFSVRATSYYADRPEKSMALIAEPGEKAGSEQWVREGHKLGHFVVHEIRQGAVVFRQGQDLKEVAVDQSQKTRGLVRDVHTAAPKVSVAAVDELPLSDSGTGPNDVASLPSGQ